MDKVLAAISLVEEHARIMGHELGPFEFKEFENYDLITVKCQNCDFFSSLAPYYKKIVIAYPIIRDTPCQPISLRGERVLYEDQKHILSIRAIRHEETFSLKEILDHKDESFKEFYSSWQEAKRTRREAIRDQLLTYFNKT